jgi:hypothetical protein
MLSTSQHVSDGTVGQNCKTKSKMLKNSSDARCSTGVSGLMKSILGAAGQTATVKELANQIRSAQAATG